MAKGVFQTFANRDLRQFRKLQMYIHAEKKADEHFLNTKRPDGCCQDGKRFCKQLLRGKDPFKINSIKRSNHR